MILYENTIPGSERPLKRVPIRGDSEEESGGSEDESDYQNLSSDDDELEKSNQESVLLLLHSLGLNYWNNLNLNLPQLNLRNTSLWKIYENGVENLSKTTGFMINRVRPECLDLDLLEEFSDTLDLQDIFISSKKGIKDPEERFGPYFPKSHHHALDSHHHQVGDRNAQDSVFGDEESEEEGESESEDEAVVLSEEFWSSIITATTEGCPETSVCLPVPGSQTVVKAPMNPFFYRTTLSVYDIIKLIIGTIFLVPIRAIGFAIALFFAWFMAVIATTGISTEELRAKPITGWRWAMRWVIANIVMRMLFFSMGFYWVKKKGTQASGEEAPILVVGPHSSYFDAFPFILMGAPSIVAKSDVADIPAFGKLVDLTQAVYVFREQKASRDDTKHEITNRATSTEDWPQIYIYPEGTCTNRSCLISFKLGPFIPGVPVQPVLIKYPNRCDSITWSFDGPSAAKSLWMTLAQFVNHCELEFLPVYNPSEAEKADPSLFANNVRQVMADAMGIPVTDYTQQDGIAMTKIKTEHLISKLKDISRLRSLLKTSSFMDMNLVRTISSNGTNAWWVTVQSFSDYLGLQDTESELVEELFRVFDKDNTGTIDIREYFVYSCLLNHNIRVDKIIPVVFLMYAEGRKRMAAEGFVQLMQCVFDMSENDACEFFQAGQTEASNTIDLDKFSKKLKKRLEYLRLYALEATGFLNVYPPRDREINASKYHPPLTTHSQTKSKVD